MKWPAFGAADLADSGFTAMTALFEAIGVEVKPSKTQSPDTEHVVQGVVFTITPEGVRLALMPKRVDKVLAAISEALDTGRLEPARAQRLTGKLTFIKQSM